MMSSTCSGVVSSVMKLTARSRAELGTRVVGLTSKASSSSAWALGRLRPAARLAVPADARRLLASSEAYC